MLELATDHAADIDISAGGLVIGIVLGALVFAVLEWVGAPRPVSALAGVAVGLLIALG